MQKFTVSQCYIIICQKFSLFAIEQKFTKT